MNADAVLWSTTSSSILHHWQQSAAATTQQTLTNAVEGEGKQQLNGGNGDTHDMSVVSDWVSTGHYVIGKTCVRTPRVMRIQKFEFNISSMRL